MEARMEQNGYLSVPQFGGWDHKAPGATDYSMVFSRARANRKQHKREISRASLGNEKELMAAYHQDDPIMVRHPPVPNYAKLCPRRCS
ncbi:uncharacterized protein LOC115735347 isoform X1 [Rhodamnia argentea]|uniref:Uncharacterized protein LOC115735347 isoform X1 n=1 Tax=Rhodamnia argentea TaxID=178133 RepID=A0ABM3HT02_9MYRT|nr:uncharacterized protein LOC115735347 isoform X1 [Rhodamnia argentea]